MACIYQPSHDFRVIRCVFINQAMILGSSGACFVIKYFSGSNCIKSRYTLHNGRNTIYYRWDELIFSYLMTLLLRFLPYQDVYDIEDVYSLVMESVNMLLVSGKKHSSIASTAANIYQIIILHFDSSIYPLYFTCMCMTLSILTFSPEVPWHV